LNLFNLHRPTLCDSSAAPAAPAAPATTDGFLYQCWRWQLLSQYNAILQSEHILGASGEPQIRAWQILLEYSALQEIVLFVIQDNSYSNINCRINRRINSRIWQALPQNEQCPGFVATRKGRALKMKGLLERNY
jgi:hypothetical protein